MPNQDSVQEIQDALHLPCPSCGSHLHYSAKHRKIICSYCGYQEEIDTSTDKVVEQSLSEAAAKLREFIPEENGKKVFDCQNCGAHFMVESEAVQVNCGFCGSRNVNLEAFQHQYIKPVGIVPFYVARDEAERKFNEWIKKGWFRPNSLKKMAAVEDLHGIYIPFWTYDAQTESDWKGEAGHYYYVNKTVMVDGKPQVKRVRKVRWTYRSGHLSHFFDDTLVVASGGLDQQKVDAIFPYNLKE